MNISIYRKDDGTIEFSGPRSDGQIVKGIVESTDTFQVLLDKLEQTKTPEELEELEKKEEQSAIQLALAEIYETLATLITNEETTSL